MPDAAVCLFVETCLRRHQTVVDTHKIHAEVSEAFSRELFVSHT